MTEINVHSPGTFCAVLIDFYGIFTVQLDLGRTQKEQWQKL